MRHALSSISAYDHPAFHTLARCGSLAGRKRVGIPILSSCMAARRERRGETARYELEEAGSRAPFSVCFASQALSFVFRHYSFVICIIIFTFASWSSVVQFSMHVVANQRPARKSNIASLPFQRFRSHGKCPVQLLVRKSSAHVPEQNVACPLEVVFLLF